MMLAKAELLQRVTRSLRLLSSPHNKRLTSPVPSGLLMIMYAMEGVSVNFCLYGKTQGHSRPLQNPTAGDTLE